MRDKKAEQEWKDWQKIVEALKKIGVDINNHDELVEAIRQWGISYAEFVKRGR